MESLSAAASGIAVVSVAIQLADSVKKLHVFWCSVKEAPDDVRDIANDLVLLSAVLTQIAHEAQHSDPDITMVYALGGCQDKVRRLLAILNDIEPGFASKSLRIRKWTALRAVLKQGQLDKFQKALDRLKSTLVLAQQTQIR